MALLRHAQDFFRSDLVGLFAWDHVKIDPPQKREEIPPNVDYRERRLMMEARQGLGKFLEQERLTFGPWEILMYSSAERGPLGELILRDKLSTAEVVRGPLDPAVWSKVGAAIRERACSGSV
jgi:hypothetical protein